MKSIFPKLNFTLWDWIGILVCSIPAFYLLGTPAIYIWDEAVYGNASLDISNGSSWILPVHGEYNTKPPLVLWMQALSLKIFPWPEFAIRLPSALSVTGILLMMTMGLKRWGFSLWSRLMVMICFIGHEGFIRHHISRTGDLDAVMTMFVMGYTMIALDAIHFKRWSTRHLFFFFFMITAAFYSKSIGGWMMLGPLGILILLSPVRKILLSVRFWLGAFASAGLCLLYYFIRESQQPGYFSLTWYSEYMRMFDNVMPWHEQPFNFYFKNFVRLKTFTPWIYFLMAAVLYGFILLKETAVKAHVMRWVILAFGYLLIISIPSVKLEWYDAPAYPFFAMILGVTMNEMTKKLPEKWKLLWLIPIAFIFWRKLYFISKDIFPRHPFEFEGSMLRKTNVSANTKVFMPVETPEHQLQLDFYRKLKFKEAGEEIEVLESADELKEGSEVIVSPENLKIISNEFVLDTVNDFGNVGLEVKLINRKSIQ